MAHQCHIWHESGGSNTVGCKCLKNQRLARNSGWSCWESVSKPSPKGVQDYRHFPVPSTIVMYRSMGRSVSRSVIALGCGHFISSQSILDRLPMPSTRRGSCEERKLPPPTFVRLLFRSDA